MIAAIRYDDSAASVWDRCAASARNGFFMFQRGYMDYHRDRYHDHSMLFANDGPPIALLPATRDGDVLISHGGLPFGGLLVLPGCRLRQVREMFDRLVDHLRHAGIHRFVYRAIPNIYHSVQGEEDLYVLEVMGARLTDTRVSCALRIGGSGEVRSSRRREIAVGKTAGVRVQRSGGVAPFMETLAQCLKQRHGTSPVHRLEEMALLHSRFPDNIRVWNAWLGDELVAGAMLYRDRVCSRVQYAASTELGRAASALDLVYDHLIQKELPANTWLDFGASMRPDDGRLNEPLMFYKESFGARTLLYRTYVLEID